MFYKKFSSLITELDEIEGLITEQRESKYFFSPKKLGFFLQNNRVRYFIFILF